MSEFQILKPVYHGDGSKTMEPSASFFVRIKS